MPFLGPLGAIKIGFIDDEFVVNPSKSQLSNSKLELVLAGTKEGVLMIESEAHELSEKQMLDAVVLGQENYKTVIEAIISLAKKAAKEPWDLKEKDEEIKNLPSKINEDFGKDFIDAYKITEKQKRSEKLSSLRNEISEKFVSETLSPVLVSDAIKNVEKDIVRGELINTGNRIDETGAAVTPLHLTSTFRQPSFSSSEKFVYSRTGGPTIDALEENFAMLEDAKFSFAFASGMAAMSAIFLMFKPGDHVLISQNVYGGVFRLVTKVLNDNGVDFDFIDTTNLKIIKDSIRDNTKLIHLETPSNPLLEIADISSVSKLCKPKNILVSVDNTFMSPSGQKPLNLGADIVMHSTTKYIGGHSDIRSLTSIVHRAFELRPQHHSREGNAIYRINNYTRQAYRVSPPAT